MSPTSSVGKLVRLAYFSSAFFIPSALVAQDPMQLFNRGVDLSLEEPVQEPWVDGIVASTTFGVSLFQIPLSDAFPQVDERQFNTQNELDALGATGELQDAVDGRMSVYGIDAENEFELGLDGELLKRPKYLHSRIWQDHVNFFSPDKIAMTAGVFAIGAVIANTNLDTSIQQHVHSSLQHANTDDWLESLRANKEIGNGKVTIPIFASAWAIGSLLPDGVLSENSRNWGERSIRGFVVGAPAVIVLQMATGGSRPGESRHDSEWQPFEDNNGVSGHAFMGALPFITAAKMSDSLGMKAIFYGASTLPGLSRTGEAAHYPSQVMLGWWMAYMAATAVDMTDNPKRNWTLYPMATTNSTGMAFEYKF